MLSSWRNSWHLLGLATQELAALWKDNKLQSRDTIVDGLESLPRAFVGIFRGENTGKMLVKL